jgi:nitrite reductase (NADH) large subunit
VVIVGSGIAGLSAAESVRQVSPAAEITLVSGENHLPYYRLNLTRFLAGEISEEQLPVHPSSWYDEQKIRLLRGVEAGELATADRTVRLRNGESLAYDKLILANGAQPFVPPAPGSERDGVVTIRSVDDARRLLETVRPGMPVVCIGGGILGLESAAALARRGADVTILERSDWLMPRQLNQTAGELLKNDVARLGIRLLIRARVKEIAGDGRVTGVKLEDGTSLAASLVIVTAGVKPSSDLARRAGLKVNQGIVVDDRLATSRPDVLAAGDVAEHRGVLYGIWGPAQFEGNIAGLNAAGRETIFGGIPRSNTLKVLGVDLYSIGRFQPEGGDTAVDRRSDGHYACYNFRENRLVGAILLGDIRLAAAVKKAIENGTDLSALLAGKPAAKDIAEHLARSV